MNTLGLLYLALSVFLFLFSAVVEVNNFIINRKNVLVDDKSHFFKNLILVSICLYMLFFVLYTCGFLIGLIKPSQTYIKDLSLDGISILLSFLFIYAAFSMARKKRPRKNLIKLVYPSRKKSSGEILIGRAMDKTRKRHNFRLSLGDLAQHMFITGTTGSGKSNLAQFILINLNKVVKIPFLLVEFKGEYAFLQNEIEDLLIIYPGENFSINIFNPEGSLPEIHAERLYEIMESGGLFKNIEYSPQMERVLVDILKIMAGNPKLQSWDGFKISCERYRKDHAKDFRMLDSTLMGIQNRLRRYSLGSLKNIFSSSNELKMRDIFTHNTLLDLSSIIRLGGEKQDALFFLNMILKYLWDRNLELGSKNFSGIKHITVVEDAQYFAPSDLASKTRLTLYLEDIALLLRGTGECLISLATRPQISHEILANAGVLVCFQSHMQKDKMTELLNLKEEKGYYLSMLQQGYCIVRVNSLERPFLMKVPAVKRGWLSYNEVEANNKRVLSQIKIGGKEMSISKKRVKIK